MLVVGGMADNTGTLVGALLLSLLPQLLRGYVGLEPVIYGGLLILILLVLPEGIVPTLPRVMRRRRAQPGRPPNEFHGSETLQQVYARNAT